MKKTIIATTIAALLAGSALPVLAQDVNVGVDAGAGVSVETPAVDATAGADASANAAASLDNTYDAVTSSIAASAAVDLSAITEESQITIVLLSSLEGDATAGGTALDEALSANAEGQASLHANIDGNAAIKTKLEAEGYATSDVVSVQTNADGSLVVYVDDRA